MRLMTKKNLSSEVRQYNEKVNIKLFFVNIIVYPAYVNVHIPCVILLLFYEVKNISLRNVVKK